MRYSEDVKNFIKDNVKGRRPAELTALTNAKFNADFTENKMKAFMKNHQLRNGMPTKVKGENVKHYPVEVVEYIKQNLHLYGSKNMTIKINETFGTTYSKNQIHAYYNKNNLNSGITGCYEKGSVPFNKGKKKYWIGGEDTQFKKGNIPYNYVPVGTEVKTRDGYYKIKLADPKTWRYKHVLIWEEQNGPLQPGKCIIFGDGNKENLDISNLISVSKKQLLTLNRNNLISDNAELTRTGVVIADISIKLNELKKKGK